MELERNPLPAGEPTWVTTRVTNTGKDDLVWFHDSCSIAVGVSGPIDGIRWPAGRQQVGDSATWKRFILDARGVADQVRIDFTPEHFIGRGAIGCADIGIGDRITPGRSIEQRAQWNGLADRQLVPPPGGHVELTGTFEYYWRSNTGEPADISSQTIPVDLDAWVVNGGPRLLGPAQAIDAALTDQRLIAVLQAHDPGDGNEPILRFDPSTGVYEVGILQSGSLPIARAMYAQVDAATGATVGFVQRDWNYQREGNP